MTMRLAATFSALVLTGCAMTPQQMQSQSNWDVCRFTMGGPHAGVAEAEMRYRQLDCSPMYPAIAAQQQNMNQAAQNYLRSTQQPAYQMQVPRQTSCTSYRIGNTVQTDCR
jgi:hypothetical protein